MSEYNNIHPVSFEDFEHILASLPNTRGKKKEGIIMKLYTTTGKTLNNDYRGTALQSCKPTDYATKERVFVDYGGKLYERTIHERAIYRTMKPNTLWSRFVIIEGQFLEVEETDFFIEWTTDFYPTPTWVCYIAEDGDIVDGVAGYDTPMEAWEGMLEENELVSNRRD